MMKGGRVCVLEREGVCVDVCDLEDDDGWG